MPKLAGVSLLAILAGGVVHFIVGSLFYGLAFAQVWQQSFLVAHGAATPAQAAALSGQPVADALLAVPGQMDMATSMTLGVVVSLIVGLGLGLLQGIAKPRTLPRAVGLGLLA